MHAAEEILARIRRAEENILPLAASEIPFVRNAAVLVLVQFRELQAFLDAQRVPPYAVEVEERDR